MTRLKQLSGQNQGCFEPFVRMLICGHCWDFLRAQDRPNIAPFLFYCLMIFKDFDGLGGGSGRLSRSILSAYFSRISPSKSANLCKSLSMLFSPFQKYFWTTPGANGRKKKDASNSNFCLRGWWFTFDSQKLKAYELQNHRCVHCVAHGVMTEYAYEDMQGDHIVPWSQGGHTTDDNL